MPDKTTITLHASGAETASGVGSSIDLANRTYTEVRLDITAIAASTTLTVTIETSPTQSSWTTIAHIKPQTAQGATDVVVPSGMRYLRARWALAGTSATCSIIGTAHQLYVLPEDLGSYGLPANALASVPLAEVARACLNASEEADGYLAKSNTLPMASLDGASRKHITNMIMFELFRFRTTITGAAKADVEVGRSEAIAWFGKIATGKVTPPGMTDSTPETPDSTTGAAAQLYVASSPGRGWG